MTLPRAHGYRNADRGLDSWPEGEALLDRLVTAGGAFEPGGAGTPMIPPHPAATIPAAWDG